MNATPLSSLSTILVARLWACNRATVLWQTSQPHVEYSPIRQTACLLRRRAHHDFLFTGVGDFHSANKCSSCPAVSLRQNTGLGWTMRPTEDLLPHTSYVADSSIGLRTLQRRRIRSSKCLSSRTSSKSDLDLL
ncbi:hypothetical protein BD311DRAFT_10962 [Dichomitus squalens]|uniref:Secreted protein n=1 Tax=Dichomitus squalens TaxID=114155 RepID=A0A4Q9N516_9APHY|nr:hypothetical protein BD311DRAFT_10962 [Dichomitus squalens]